jgi:glycosyltransferase involved in cell wall biosynthesis
MAHAKLEICIPSFQRPKKALDTVVAFYRQFDNSSVKITVLDNHSDDEYLEVFKNHSEIGAGLDLNLVKVTRHVGNIGMSGNILRAFEIAQSEWIWIVSDDDVIVDGCLKLVYAAIDAAKPECAQIQFTSERSRPMGKFEQIDSIDKFIQFNSRSIGHFNGSIFLSNSIYRRSVFQNLLSWGYIHAHTYIPHFMMSVTAVSQGSHLTVIGEDVVRYTVPEVGYSYGLIGGLGVGGLKVLPNGFCHSDVPRYLAIFNSHHDIKVIIDLYFYCRSRGLPKLFGYYSRLYISQIYFGRSWFEILLCKIIIQLTKSKTIFGVFVKILYKYVPSTRRHIDEMKLKYGPGYVDGKI